MRLAALALAVLLAGCSFADPMSERSVRVPPVPCEPLRVSASAPSIAVGEPVDIHVTVLNCGEEAIALEMCGSPVTVTTERSGQTFFVVGRVAPEAATDRDPRACPLDTWGVQPMLMPGAESASTYRWNGTFSTDPCLNLHDVPEDACRAWVAAAPGAHELVARVAGFVGRASIDVREGPAWPAPSGPCGLALDVEPQDILVAQDARIVATLRNCEEDDLVIGESSLCGTGNGFHVTAENGTRAYRIGTSGAAPAADAEQGCLHMLPSPRVIFPGATARVWFGWNGTTWGETRCADEAGCESDVRAVPGDYVLRADATDAQGRTYAATARLVVG
ncbi:MAG TPA: hypothetical protein VM370_13405 [Candidatus Thermoplasmatota archaeon]|nr:hypothetical protein [Candidatus Thermoplasmatota archaeon]